MTTDLQRPDLKLPDVVMTNCDHTIDEDVARELKSKPDHYAQYSGWNFCGNVWWAGERWACLVWVYHVQRKIVTADTLEEIMRLVSDEFGEG